MRIRIVRKLAAQLDGIDLSKRGVGDVVDMPEREARVIVAEQWAVPARRESDSNASAVSRRHAVSDDLLQRLQNKRDAIEQERRRFHRRASDAPTTHAA